jgi:hypothetical protein
MAGAMVVRREDQGHPFVDGSVPDQCVIAVHVRDIEFRGVGAHVTKQAQGKRIGSGIHRKREPAYAHRPDPFIGRGAVDLVSEDGHVVSSLGAALG